MVAYHFIFMFLQLKSFFEVFVFLYALISILQCIFYYMKFQSDITHIHILSCIIVLLNEAMQDLQR